MEEKLISNIPDFKTKVQYSIFINRIDEQIKYLKFLKKQAKKIRKQLKED